MSCIPANHASSRWSSPTPPSQLRPDHDGGYQPNQPYQPHPNPTRPRRPRREACSGQSYLQYSLCDWWFLVLRIAPRSCILTTTIQAAPTTSTLNMVIPRHGPKSVEEIVKDAQNFDHMANYPLRIALRTAQNMLNQVSRPDVARATSTMT